jgi:hypothetical protein
MKPRIAILLLVTAALLAASSAVAAPAQAGRPVPPDPPPQMWYFCTWTTGAINVGVTVAQGGTGVFNFAVVHEPNILVQCYLVLTTQKGRTTTTFGRWSIGSYLTCNDGLNLLVPLPSYYTWKNVSLPTGTYRWHIEAWDAQAGEWAHVSSTASLTVTR